MSLFLEVNFFDKNDSVVEDSVGSEYSIGRNDSLVDEDGDDFLEVINMISVIKIVYLVNLVIKKVDIT